MADIEDIPTTVLLLFMYLGAALWFWMWLPMEDDDDISTTALLQFMFLAASLGFWLGPQAGLEEGNIGIQQALVQTQESYTLLRQSQETHALFRQQACIGSSLAMSEMEVCNVSEATVDRYTRFALDMCSAPVGYKYEPGELVNMDLEAVLEG